MTGEHTAHPQEMKDLHFDYCMQMDYAEPVKKAFFTIKAIPRSNARQTIRNLQVKVLPETAFSSSTDSFGNEMVYGSVDLPHTSFVYEISGDAEIGQILFEEQAKEEEIPKFRHPYGMNRPGTALKAYFEELKSGLEENVYVNAIFLMRRLHQDFCYQKEITNVKTTAEEAWKLGGGVCQDYAHIFIALCQMAGIPARYVTGIIIGEGESHAWAEILYHGKWIGMDPTNDVLVARSHIKFGHGRDASDCMLNRGILRGGGKQQQTIRVNVSEE